MRIVLRYYQLSLMYNNGLVSDRCNNMLNNPAMSDPPILSYVV